MIKLGADGVLVAEPGGRELVSPLKVEVVNGLGAGDAFGGALCHRLLAAIVRLTRCGLPTPPGAYVVGQLACADAMPTEAQVTAMME